MIDYNMPFERFDDIFEQAKQKCGKHYNAMTLSTVNANGIASGRVVLLKNFDYNGFVFFTNINSNKANDINENNNVSLCFFWHDLEIQIRIQGVAEQISNEDADIYFAKRIRESQIGAWASRQSQIMQGGRKELEDNIEFFNKKFEDKEVDRPQFWSGYNVVPRTIEFWKMCDFRLHIRELYNLNENNKWDYNIIYP